MSLISTYYKSLLLMMQRGNHCGVFSNAKPLFMLAIISCIEKGLLKNNQITLDESLVSEYNSLSKSYEPERDITPIGKPYFHLSAEPFYEIIYKNGSTEPKHSKSPSLKKLKDIVDDVRLDDDLWNILQDADVRQEFSKAIITHFLNK